MPTLLPVRAAKHAERLHIPTAIVQGLVFVILVAMTIVTPSKYPSMFGTSGPAAVRRY